MYYSIGEVSKMTGINISTLRYYDKEGLFPTMGRSNGGIRVFTDKELSAIKVIECLKATGLSIKDIKQYMDSIKEGDRTLSQRREIFYNQLKVVEKQLKEVEKTMELIKFKCWYYDTAIEMGSEQAVSDMPLEEMPREMQDSAAHIFSYKHNITI